MIYSFILMSSILNATVLQEIESNYVWGHGYKRGNLIPICGKIFDEKDLDGNNIFLREDAADAFLAMKQQAALDGIVLKINYAFRTKKQQKQIKKRNRRLAAKTGYSPHQQGIAIDISGTVFYKKRKKIKTEISKWLEENSKLFGFVKTIRHEDWHYEFKGKNENQYQ